MRKVLVTGANGFVGKNLCSLLKKQGYTILPVTRETSMADLKEMVMISDYCFHLAGEVRPNAESDSFVNSNTNFTRTLVDLLELKPIDIVFTSTVHAESASNDYGVTKRSAEKIIETYALNNNVSFYTLRLPHLFGPFCKPNYNSVITTWICNAIGNKELNVFDNDFELTYINVLDLSEMLIKQMMCKVSLPLPTSYTVKLGDLKETILRLLDGNLDSSNNEFEEKLAQTIKHYKHYKHYRA